MFGKTDLSSCGFDGGLRRIDRGIVLFRGIDRGFELLFGVIDGSSRRVACRSRSIARCTIGFVSNHRDVARFDQIAITFFVRFGLAQIRFGLSKFGLRLFDIGVGGANFGNRRRIKSSVRRKSESRLSLTNSGDGLRDRRCVSQ